MSWYFSFILKIIDIPKTIVIVKSNVTLPAPTVDGWLSSIDWRDHPSYLWRRCLWRFRGDECPVLIGVAITGTLTMLMTLPHGLALRVYTRQTTPGSAMKVLFPGERKHQKHNFPDISTHIICAFHDPLLFIYVKH